MRSLVWLLALLAVSGSAQAAPGDFTQYIINGKKTDDYPQVGLFQVGNKPFCTGTVVAPSLVLTAAHCVYHREAEMAAGQITFVLEVEDAVEIHRVDRGEFPNETALKFQPNDRQHDVGLAYLGTKTEVPRLTIHNGAPDWNSIGQRPLTFVGFGANLPNGSGAGLGQKREGSWPVSLAGNYGLWWARTQQSSCGGDSGGPGLLPGSPRIIAAIVSSGFLSCDADSQRFGMRVSAYYDWLQRRIR